MSAIDFVGAYVNDWVRSKDLFRNILIAGDVDDQALERLINNADPGEIRFVPGRNLLGSGDLDEILGGLEAKQLLVISRLEDMSETALDSFASFFTGGQTDVELVKIAGYTGVRRQEISLICTIDSSCTISRALYEAFEIKILLGHDVQVSIANDDDAAKRAHEFVKEMAYSHQGAADFSVLSFEMAIILRIDSYLSENPEWYQTISYCEAKEDGGVYSVVIEGANEDLPKAVFKKFSGVGQFAVQQDGKILFGGI